MRIIEVRLLKIQNHIEMKKNALFIFLCGIAASCSDAGMNNSPKSVARDFLEQVSQGKYEEAKLYGTQNTAKLLDFSNMMLGSTDKTFDYTITKDSIEGDHAWVFFYDGRTKRQESMDLIKVDGKWKVDLRMKK